MSEWVYEPFRYVLTRVLTILVGATSNLLGVANITVLLSKMTFFRLATPPNIGKKKRRFLGGGGGGYLS